MMSPFTFSTLSHCDISLHNHCTDYSAATRVLILSSSTQKTAQQLERQSETATSAERAQQVT